jgi:hypothetical protein
MFEDDDRDEGGPRKKPADPATRARDKSDEFRMHAELASVFEGTRKFDASVVALNADVARDIQRAVAKLEKSKPAETPLLMDAASLAEGERLLKLPGTAKLSTNDYHVYLRPGETMVARFLAGKEEADQFYERLQAHFDAGLNHFRQEERSAQEWKQDPQTLAYLDALDAIQMKMADRYIRTALLKVPGAIALSTQTADEMDILYLADHVMQVPVTEIVAGASAPPEGGATERDRAWFFKLFSLRGVVEGMERMMFFAYLQKTDDSGW